MASRNAETALVPVERGELVTSDMDLLAARIRELHAVDRTAARFRCPDPARVDGRVYSAAAGGLNAALIRYGGFAISSELGPVSRPTAIVCTRGSGIITTAREDLRLTAGDVFLGSLDLPAAGTMGDGDYTTLQVPWAVACSMAEASTGLPAADLRLESMAPVSAAAQPAFAATAEFICGQLVRSRTTGISPLLAQELTRLAAAAFLVTFPNTTMTAGYLPGPGWVPPAAVRRAAEFIEAQAGRAVSLTEVAAVAGVTGRTLQYAFRRYLGTTPTGYLRRIRLERAHDELRAADPASGTTVAAVARSWGWASASQFTVAYQQRFGVLPSHTLRT